MPRTPTIYFNDEEFNKLKDKAQKNGHKSMYAYIKKLIRIDMKN